MKMTIGAQMYTVRDFCQDTASLAESLKKIAEIGYKTVQVSGVCEYDPTWLKAELDKNGLRCVVTHISGERLEKEPERTAKDHDAFHCKYIGLGYYVFDAENCGTEDYIKRYRHTAEVLREHGKYFLHHNHASEFLKENGVLVMDRLAEAFAPDELGFLLDTYWIQTGGGDPAQWIEKLSGRVPCIHLKDYAYQGKMAVIGEGNINFDRVFEKAESSGTEYMLVEQDSCYGEDPFECLKRSYQYLHALGLE